MPIGVRLRDTPTPRLEHASVVDGGDDTEQPERASALGHSGSPPARHRRRVSEYRVLLARVKRARQLVTPLDEAPRRRWVASLDGHLDRLADRLAIGLADRRLVRRPGVDPDSDEHDVLVGRLDQAISDRVERALGKPQLGRTPRHRLMRVGHGCRFVHHHKGRPDRLVRRLVLPNADQDWRMPGAGSHEGGH